MIIREFSFRDTLFSLAFILFCAPLLSGCDEDFLSEGPFSGDLPVNIVEMNSPYQMREYADIRGNRYLAVLNTNASLRFANGSLHFYRVDGPDSFSRETAWDLKVPTLVGDFQIIPSGDDYLLFVVDRSDRRLRPYVLAAGSDEFVPMTKEDGSSYEFETFRNPRQLTFFTSGGKDYLALNSFGSGAIQFFDLETFAWFDLDDLTDKLGDQLHQATIHRSQELIGGRLRMEAFQSPMNLNGARGLTRSGQGIHQALYVGDAVAGQENFFIFASELTNAIFGFRFDTFENSANLLWNLRHQERGFKPQGQDRIPGSRERGFRSLQRDGADHLFLSSRTDNRIYRIPLSAFEFSTNRFNNTFAFEENAQNYSLVPQANEAGFPVDLDEEQFPRLGDMVVNGQLANETADQIWVLGLEGDRGFEVSRLYRLGLDNSHNPPRYQIAQTHEFKANESPQRLIYFEDLERIAVALHGGHEIHIFNAQDIEEEPLKLEANIE